MIKISGTKGGDWLKQTSILSQALPFMQRYAGKNITIKYGGSAMGEDKLSSSFARDIVLLKQVGINPIVIHGGGPRIKKMFSRISIFLGALIAQNPNLKHSEFPFSKVPRSLMH